jgi:hypothetical protein
MTFNKKLRLPRANPAAACSAGVLHALSWPLYTCEHNVQPDFSGGSHFARTREMGAPRSFTVAPAPINNRDAHPLHSFDSASVGKVGALVEVQV